MGCGARVSAKRFSTASSIMSRTSDPLMPAPLTAVQEMISRSKAFDDEGQAEDVAVPAGELEAVGAPAQVRAQVGTARLALPPRPLGQWWRQALVEAGEELDRRERQMALPVNTDFHLRLLDALVRR